VARAPTSSAIPRASRWACRSPSTAPPNDGQSGEGDNILPGIKNVTGTEFADALVGSNLANRFSGLGGNDVINPGAGSDVVLAGDGDDRVDLRDGVRDQGNGNAVMTGSRATRSTSGSTELPPPEARPAGLIAAAAFGRSPFPLGAKAGRYSAADLGVRLRAR
jgi:hypothetical protein